MRLHPDTPSWFSPPRLEPGIEPADNPREFERLWRGFMTARVTLGLVLLLLQGAIYGLGASNNHTLILLCSGYLAATLAVRLRASPRALGQTFDAHWLSTIGVDMVAFAALQATQGGSINYAPLLALPVLMAAVLGSLLLALGAAAGVTLWLLGYASWLSLHAPADTAAHFLQAALTGAGCFAISFLANQMAARLANVELRAQHSQLAARVQSLVNELVIESLAEGILVVDQHSLVRSANPAARRLLGAEGALQQHALELTARLEWQGLRDLMQHSFASKLPQQADITIHPARQGPRRVQVRTQLTATQGGGSEGLCVMFLQDQRETEARIRTEKLASMGRMSAAVAHEIRNPLAAIVQANALLDEDLADPKQKHLTRMVQQNARRLEKIVDDVLNIARVQQDDRTCRASGLVLNQAAAAICHDWQEQTGNPHLLRLELPADSIAARFELEHLRRIMVNLLDNARRYASQQPGSIQVALAMTSSGQGTLGVWSDGPPMEPSVERHLFEPFFSSESRSSGLGLYICRALCEGHGASIAYQRTCKTVGSALVEGNEFMLTFQMNPAYLTRHAARAPTSMTP